MYSSITSDNFYTKVKEFYDRQEDIQNKLKNIANNFNIFQSDKVKTELLAYKRELSDYKKEYLKSNFISLLSERDYHNRKNELEELESQCNSMLKKYNKFLSDRFGPNFNESDFQEKQFDTMEEKMMYQKKKLQDQDDMIEFMIGVNNENRQITKEMGNNISKQNSLLDKVNKDIDNLNDKMNRSNLKVTNFLAKSSYCRLYVIAIVQALIIIWLIL
jgi:hypothetical protein